MAGMDPHAGTERGGASAEWTARQRRVEALGQLASERLTERGAFVAPSLPTPATPATPAPAPGPPEPPGPGPRQVRHAHLWWLGAAGVALCLVVVGAALLGPRLLALTAAGHGASRTGPDAQRAPTVACAPSGSQGPFPNIRVSDDNFKAHSEPMLAQNPANPLNLVGGSKFFSDPAHYRFKIGTFASFDGGCTWSDGGMLPGFEQRDLTSDISFAFGPHNAVYAAVLFTGPGQNISGIAVSTSHDGGKTFGQPVTVYQDSTGTIFSDKPWIAVDQTHGPRAGWIYAVWSYDTGGNCGDGNSCVQALGFSRSTDGGQTFTPVAFEEGNAPFCDYPVTGRASGSTRCDAVIGATPAVGPDGTLSVAYAYYDLMSGPLPTRLVVVNSPDGGTTWGIPSLVATITDVMGDFPPERYRNETLPAFACDPRTGQLYIAWSGKATRYPNVYLATSADRGAHWSAPLRVNDDALGTGALHFQPQLAVAPDGVVTVSFFDTRTDPNHLLIDVFIAQSVDHGASFLPNVRVTSQSWDPAVDAPIDGYGNQFIGDYQGLAASDRYVYPFWNDTRTGAQEIFTAVVPSVGADGR